MIRGKVMAEYRAIYKCRLCGQEYETAIATDMATVKEYIIQALTGYDTGRLNCKKTPSETEVHDCKNGSIGIASFLGFRKTDDEEK